MLALVYMYALSLSVQEYYIFLCIPVKFSKMWIANDNKLCFFLNHNIEKRPILYKQRDECKNMKFKKNTNKIRCHKS